MRDQPKCPQCGSPEYVELVAGLVWCPCGCMYNLEAYPTGGYEIKLTGGYEINPDDFQRISWSADPAGILPGGRCHTSPDGVVQWAVWHDTKGRRAQRVISINGVAVEGEETP